MTVHVRRRPGRPTGGEHVVDREHLLDAAERVIARDGSGASLETIAAEAGVTKPIVYARVGSRAALSNALAARLAERLLMAASVEVGATSGLGRESLASFMRSTLTTIGEHRELFLYVTRGAADDTPERTLYLAARSAEPLARLLARWRTRHDQGTDVAMAWAYAIIGMLNLVALWWLEESDLSVTELADQLAELVWTGLGAR